MSPLNHKRTTSSLVPPIICVAKKLAPHFLKEAIFSRTALSNPFATRHPVKCGEWLNSEYLKNKTFWTKLEFSNLIHTFMWKNPQKARMCPGYLLSSRSTLRFVDLSSDLTLLGSYISKKWRMDTFIRHKCGEHKNNVRQRCSRSRKIFFFRTNALDYC